MHCQRPPRNTLFMNQVAAIFAIIFLISVNHHHTLAQPNTLELLKRYRNEILDLTDRLKQKELEVYRISEENHQLRNDKRFFEDEINALKNRIRLLETYLFNRSGVEQQDMEVISQEMQQANIDFQEINQNFENLKTNFIRSSFYVFYASHPGPSSSMMVLRRPVEASMVKFLEFSFNSIESPALCYVTVRDRSNRVYIDRLPVTVEGYKGSAFVKVSLNPGYYTVYITTDRRLPDYVCYDFSLF